jgi:hypothetical protein
VTVFAPVLAAVVTYIEATEFPGFVVVATRA